MICKFCSNPISKNEHFILVGTYNRPLKKPKEETFFHFQCFIEYFNNCVKNKADSTINAIKQQGIQLLDSKLLMGMIKKVTGASIDPDLKNKIIKITVLKSKSESEIKEDKTTGKKDGRRKTKTKKTELH